MGTADDVLREANEDLTNWGRSVTDVVWLNQHLLHAPLPTSEGYIAPIVTYDESPDWGPVDELWAEKVNEWVQELFQDHIESYQVIQYWYTKAIFMHLAGQPLPREERIKRLSKRMHTGYKGAERMLAEAQRRYWIKRIRRAA